MTSPSSRNRDSKESFKRKKDKYKEEDYDDNISKEEDDTKNDKERKSSSKRHRRRRDRSSSPDRDRDREQRKHKRKHKKHHRKERRHRHRKDDDDNDSDGSDNHKDHRTSRKRSRRHADDDDDKKDKTKLSSSSSSKKPFVPQPPANLYPMGDPLGHAPPTKIDPDRDYFAFHREFWVYLYRQEGIYFNDLTSTEETHEAFRRFAQAYNEGQLERPYYASSSLSSSSNPPDEKEWPTFPPAVLEECKTTQHRWSFRTTATEEKGLQALQEGVRRLTEYNKEDSKE